MLKREKTWGRRKEKDPAADFFFSSERVSNFSLDLWKIRPSVVLGTRRKTALRGEGFAWVPYLRSLDKLLEVGVSPYLGFILCLSTM